MATVYGYTPTHAGEVVKDEIEYRGMSQRTLSERTGISYKVLNDILNGRRGVSTQTALRIEAALDIPADALLRLQLKYDMHMARNDSKLSATLRHIRQESAAASL